MYKTERNKGLECFYVKHRVGGDGETRPQSRAMAVGLQTHRKLCVEPILQSNDVHVNSNVILVEGLNLMLTIEKSRSMVLRILMDGYNNSNTFYMQTMSWTQCGSSVLPMIDWQGERVEAVIYANPILGYGTKNTSDLQFWVAKSNDQHDMKAYNSRDYVDFVKNILMNLMGSVFPRQLQIIYYINSNGGEKLKSMVGLYYNWLEIKSFKNFYELWKHMLHYKTNGVRQCCWIVINNSSSYVLILKWLGTKAQIHDIDLLICLRNLTTNVELHQEWSMARNVNKIKLIEYMEAMSGAKVTWNEMFELQEK
ncbi:hypothetical protein V6N11_084336 [Hibiscus sabdariffa]|uniref:Alpha-1,4 glucan phosphorylase n=1 Tax=Hibiscus sabdariffa TaxID=183260 RepID=A0ABR2QSS6_9ROSI